MQGGMADTAAKTISVKPRPDEQRNAVFVHLRINRNKLVFDVAS
jgi:hypothetical protein